MNLNCYAPPVLATLWLLSPMAVRAQGPLLPSGPPTPSLKTLHQIEPRIPIGTLPVTLTNSGSYYLTTNLHGSGGPGILVQASGVTIDLHGFSIVKCASGISAAAGVKDVTVLNGFIRDGTGPGIALGAAENCRLQGVTLAENQAGGAFLGAGSSVSYCTAFGNSGPGFSVGDGGEIHHCVARSNSASGIELGSFGQARENTCTFNGAGVGDGGLVLNGQSSRAEDNACHRNNGFGLRITGTNNLAVRNSGCGNTILDYAIASGNLFGQVFFGAGPAFASSNAWANFSCGPQPVACPGGTCNDNNPCTTDSCIEGACVFSAAPNGTACTDNSVCTTSDACVNGVCVGSAITCPDDANACTSAACNPATGCFQANNTAACDDGNLCTINDTCSNGTCTSAPKNCSDGNPCTTDLCNPATGVCFYTNNSAACSDGNPCTTGDFCSGGSCQPGAGTLNCNDSNPCTGDVCNPAIGCVYTNMPSGTSCNDSSVCTSSDVCNNGVCAGTPITCPDDANICTTAACHPVTGCYQANNNAACNDGNACTINDICASGTCGGTAKNCSDGNVCTTDGCDPGTGNCTHSNNTAACSDGNACTTGDQCSGGLCQPGAGTLTCNDNNPCTSDSCNPSTGCFYNNLADLTTCPGGYCQSGVCVAAQANGTACSVSAQCASGFCVDGVCCNTTCTALCQACSAVKKGSGANGTCGNIAAGTDPDNECAGATNCNGSGICQ